MHCTTMGRAQTRRAPFASIRAFIAASCFALLLILQSGGCARGPEAPPQKRETMPKRDINEVLRAHDRELMAIPGVVGVYVGVLDDEKTPCLKVMVVEKTPELEQRLPKSLESYPVVIDVTGTLRPMPSNKR